MVGVFQLNKVRVWVKCRCLYASSSAFYPLQHPHIRISAHPHFTPGQNCGSCQNGLVNSA